MFQDDTSTAENFAFCTNAFAKEIFSKALVPVFKIFEMFQGIIGGFMGNLNHYLKYLAGIGNFTLSFANSVFSKLFNTMSVFTKQMGHLRDLFERVTSSAYYAVFVVQTAVSFVVSLVKFGITLIQAMVIIMFALSFILALFFPIVLAFVIPLGAMVGVTYCFHPDTRVHTDRGDILMSNIRLGDRVGSSVITGVFEFECVPEVELYTYNGVVVSGRHLVNHFDEWMYVKDTGAAKFNGPRPRHLICVNTSNNVINIQNNLFRDYEEVDPEDLDAIGKIEHILWGKPIGAADTPALFPTVRIPLTWGVSSLDELSIGDVLANGAVVKGVVSIDTKGKQWYYVKGAIVSGGQPIMIDGKLVLAKDVGLKIPNQSDVGYQLFLDRDDGLFELEGGMVVRDYPDSHDINVLEEIQRVVLDSLNQ